MCNFKTRLEARGYPKTLIKKGFLCRTAVGTQKTNQTNKRQTFAFRDDLSSRGKELKTKTDAKLSLVQNQPLLRTILKTLPIISDKKDKSLKDMLVRAEL